MKRARRNVRSSNTDLDRAMKSKHGNAYWHVAYVHKHEKYKHMKKVLLGLILVLSIGSFRASAQCDESLKKQALKEMGESQYIKDFSIDLKKAKKDLKTGFVKFSVILNSRNQYRFTVVNHPSNPEEVIMQLYDGERLLISNFEGGKIGKAPDFLCRTTKVYQLTFSFRGGEEGCAEAVISLVKQYAEGEL